MSIPIGSILSYMRVNMWNTFYQDEESECLSLSVLCDPMDCGVWSSPRLEHWCYGKIPLLQGLLLTQELNPSLSIAGKFFTMKHQSPSGKLDRHKKDGELWIMEYLYTKLWFEEYWKEPQQKKSHHPSLSDILLKLQNFSH